MSLLNKCITLLRDWANFGNEFAADRLATPPVCLLRAFGNGRAIKVCLSEISPESLYLTIERKIVSSDVTRGRLKPIVQEGVKRRGGKRYTGLTLSLEEAEQLHRLLSVAITKAEERQEKIAIRKRFSIYFTHFIAYCAHSFQQKSA